MCEETEAGCESLETRLAKLMKEELNVRDDRIAQLKARTKSMEDDRARDPRDGFGNMDDFFDHDLFDTSGPFGCNFILKKQRTNIVRVVQWAKADVKSWLDAMTSNADDINIYIPSPRRHKS